MLTHNSRNLWEDPEGWDLRIICRYGLWLVHQEILERGAPEFFRRVMRMTKVGVSRGSSLLQSNGQLTRGETDGSQKDGKDVLTTKLSGYHPAIIGGLLKFLYINGKCAPDPYPVLIS